MIDVLRIAHLRIAPQEGNLEVGNCEGNRNLSHPLLLPTAQEKMIGNHFGIRLRKKAKTN